MSFPGLRPGAAALFSGGKGSVVAAVHGIGLWPERGSGFRKGSGLSG